MCEVNCSYLNIASGSVTKYILLSQFKLIFYINNKKNLEDICTLFLE